MKNLRENSLSLFVFANFNKQQYIAMFPSGYMNKLLEYQT